jgi:hypothetical protein
MERAMTFVAQEIPVAVLDSLSEIKDFILSYAITLAALGALTVALIEAWKKLRDTQAKFHRRSVLRWLANEGTQGATTAAGTRARTPSRHYLAAPVAPADGGTSSYDAGRCFEQLMLLTTGVGSAAPDARARYQPAVEQGRATYHRSIEFALFELDLDRLMGQVQDAADIALNNPKRFPDLFHFLTRSASEEDVRKWLQEVEVPIASLEHDDEARKVIADRYTRLKQLVRRHLDSFQIVTAMRWREWNQLWAFVVGVVLLFLAQWMTLPSRTEWALFSPSTWVLPDVSGWTLFKMIVSSLLGGMLAPVAKDLVDALSQVKKSG